MSTSTFVASLILPASLVTSMAATITVSKQEVELAVACINATQVGTVGAAAGPLARTIILTSVKN